MENKGTDPGRESEVVDFVSSITDSARLRIEENLPHGFVRLKVAEAERRQAQHDIRSVEDIVRELVRNSRDAGARNVLVAFQKEGGRYRRIIVIDDGEGIPPELHRLVFEPRVTSKSKDFEEDRYGVHGRGMALFSIHSRASNAMVVTARLGCGTVISLTADTTVVPEKSDQATLPGLETDGTSSDVGGGPHNVPRVLLEMSVDSPQIDFYLGSFAEVLATLRALEVGEGRVWSRILGLEDAGELVEASSEVLGMPVSERNAYRILRNEIPPLVPVYRQATVTEEITPIDKSGETTYRVRHPLRRLARDDLKEIENETRGIVDRVLSRYYLRCAGEGRIRKGRGKITITFHVSGDESDDAQ